ncbi:MAG: hypothetical protein PHX87_01630 [Candidatus Peribacteraceae bacterium]|nr:hypothetical protein [Candidatus Peribacteraceae bacterium]MDD5742108.1 hypothetical protein [Candidatus Peribacteraceae bacterium]
MRFPLRPFPAHESAREHAAAERRLIFKTAAGPEAPKETVEGGKEKSDAKPKKEGGEAVKKETDKVRDAVKSVVPEVEAPPPAEMPAVPTEGPRYMEMPTLAEGMRNTRNAVLTTLGVALPPLGIAGLAAAGIGRYVGSKFSKQPLGMGQVAKDTFVRVPAEGIKSVFRTITFPFRWAGAAGINTLKFSGHQLYRGLDATVGEFYRDVMKGINHKFKLPEGTNPVAATVIGLKAAALFPFRLTAALAKTALEKPIRTAVAAVILTALVSNPTATITAGGALVDKILSIINAIVTKIPGA